MSVNRDRAESYLIGLATMASLLFLISVIIVWFNVFYYASSMLFLINLAGFLSMFVGVRRYQKVSLKESIPLGDIDRIITRILERTGQIPPQLQELTNSEYQIVMRSLEKHKFNAVLRSLEKAFENLDEHHWESIARVCQTLELFFQGITERLASTTRRLARHGLTIRQMIGSLKNLGIISGEDSDSIVKLIAVGNRIIHSSYTPTREESEQFFLAAIRVIQNITNQYGF
ncbi:MAG: hypothetical protein ACFFEK_03905 [Candidatus Thorarchaeota archaeon]